MKHIVSLVRIIHDGDQPSAIPIYKSDNNSFPDLKSMILNYSDSNPDISVEYLIGSDNKVKWGGPGHVQFPDTFSFSGIVVLGWDKDSLIDCGNIKILNQDVTGKSALFFTNAICDINSKKCKEIIPDEKIIIQMQSLSRIDTNVGCFLDIAGHIDLYSLLISPTLQKDESLIIALLN